MSKWRSFILVNSGEIIIFKQNLNSALWLHFTILQVGEKRDEFHVKTLREGEIQDFVTLKNECKANGQKFKDPEFDPKAADADTIGRSSDGEYPFSDTIKEWLRPKVIISH